MATRGEGTPLPTQTARRLVIKGPYRWIRNPMVVAGLVQGLCVGLLLGSRLAVVVPLAGALVWNYVIRPVEEADLETRFGESFRAYRRL